MPPTQQPAAPSPGGRRIQEKPGRRRRKWKRRLAYFCGWLVLVAACLAALVVGLALVGYQNAAPIANRVREQLAPDLPLKIGSITFPQTGVVELHDVTLDLPDAAGRAGKIDRIQLSYDPGHLFEPRAKALLIEQPELNLNQALLDLFAPKPGADPDAPPMNLSWVKIDELKIANGQINLDLKGIPKGSWNIDFTASDVDLAREGPLVSAHPQQLTLRGLRVDDPSGNLDTPLVSIDELAATIRLNKDFISGAVATLELTKPVVRFSPELRDALRSDPAPAAPATATASEDGGASPMRWQIDEILMHDGYFSMAGFYDTPDVSFHHSGKFTNLAWSTTDGLSWPDWQEATLSDVRIDAPVLPHPTSASPNPDRNQLLTASEINIAGYPDKFFEDGIIGKFSTTKPVIHVDAENVGRFFAAAPDDPSKLLLPPGDDEQVPPTDLKDASKDVVANVMRVTDLELADAAITVDADSFMAGLPDASFTLNLHSAAEQPDPVRDVHYELSATGLSVHPKGSPASSIVAGKEILAKFSAADVQERLRISSVTLSGLEVHLGKDVNEMIADLNSAKPPPPAAAAEPEELAPSGPPTQPAPVAAALMEWVIGTVKFDDTHFVLEDFIPGLPYLPIVLRTTLEEVPLSGRKSGDERMQKIELSNVEVLAPYNSLLPVTRLNSTWLHFTIPGLIRNEIDRIEIVSPEIFLGEPLFWYINAFQEIANNEPGAAGDGDEEKLAAHLPLPSDPCAGEVDSPEAPAEPDEAGKIAALEGMANTRISGWLIKTIEAKSGSLVIAPKGYPIGIIPFPFFGKMDFAKGELGLTLDVPRADYIFGDLDLEFIGLHGDAKFNYPPDSNKKNFVQVLQAPTVHYGDYRLDEFYLNITFNGEMIFAQFGGWAYDGYVNGELTIYIDQNYTWNGWVAATDVMLSPLTEALSADNVTLTGVLNGKIIADGEGLVPNKITGEMDTSGPCHMHVTSLDEAMKALRETIPAPAPTIWEAFLDPLNRAVSQASLAAFHHYNFTTGTAELELVGREGWAKILLDGPDGKRQIDFDIFDRRTPDATGDKQE